MSISCTLLVLADFIIFSIACRSRCRCDDKIFVCVSALDADTAVSVLHDRFLTIQKLMNDNDMSSFELYIDYRSADQTALCTDGLVLDQVRDCCGFKSPKRNNSGEIHQTEKACWRITYNDSRNRDDTHGIWPLNRTVSELIQIFDGLRTESPPTEGSSFSISTMVALLVPVCVSILILPCAILAVCCCCRSCKKNRRRDQSELDKAEKAKEIFDHYKNARKSITPTLSSSATATTTLEITSKISANSPESLTPFVPVAVLASAERSRKEKLFPQHTKLSVLREKSSSTPDLRALEAAECSEMTLSRMAVLRELQRSERSSEETDDDGLEIVDWSDNVDVPDEFYAVFLRTEDEIGEITDSSTPSDTVHWD